MSNEAAIQGSLLAVCNAIQELLGPAQVADEAEGR